MSAGDVQRIPHRTCIIDNCYGVAVYAYRGDVHKTYCSLHEPIRPSNRWNQVENAYTRQTLNRIMIDGFPSFSP